MAVTEEGYRFAAAPKVIKGSKKYRAQEDVSVCSNIMFDKRVVRGNTYSAVVVPQGQQTELMQQQEVKKRKQRDRKTGERMEVWDVGTPEAVQGRKHEEA